MKMSLPFRSTMINHDIECQHIMLFICEIYCEKQKNIFNGYDSFRLALTRAAAETSANIDSEVHLEIVSIRKGHSLVSILPIRSHNIDYFMIRPRKK